MNTVIEVNLSIKKCGGEEGLKTVIDAVKEALTSKYPEAEIKVRKGFFETIDGIYSNDLYTEGEVRQLVNTVRERALNK